MAKGTRGFARHRPLRPMRHWRGARGLFRRPQAFRQLRPVQGDGPHARTAWIHHGARVKASPPGATRVSPQFQRLRFAGRLSTRADQQIGSPITRAAICDMIALERWPCRRRPRPPSCRSQTNGQTWLDEKSMLPGCASSLNAAGFFLDERARINAYDRLRDAARRTGVPASVLPGRTTVEDRAGPFGSARKTARR